MKVKHLEVAGVKLGAPEVNIDQLRGHKEKVITKLTGGLAPMAKMRKVTIVRGYGAFVGGPPPGGARRPPAAARKTRQPKLVQFKNAIIAAGIEAVRLPFMPNDPRVVDSTGALALQGVPKKMLIVGGGIIGLEMGTVYSTLGARLDVVEMMDGLMQGADRDLVKVWQKMNQHRFDNVDAQDQNRGRPGYARRHQGAVRGSGWHQERRHLRTWCCKPWAARPTARKSAPNRLAWP